MRVVDEAERIVLLVFPGLPVALIVIDTVLRFFDAQDSNAIVGFFFNAAERATPDAVRDMFTGQEYYQTALLALVGYGVLALVVVLLFRFIRAAIRTQTDAHRTTT